MQNIKRAEHACVSHQACRTLEDDYYLKSIYSLAPHLRVQQKGGDILEQYSLHIHRKHILSNTFPTQAPGRSRHGITHVR